MWDLCVGNDTTPRLNFDLSLCSTDRAFFSIHWICLSAWLAVFTLWKLTVIKIHPSDIFCSQLSKKDKNISSLAAGNREWGFLHLHACPTSLEQWVWRRHRSESCSSAPGASVLLPLSNTQVLNNAGVRHMGPHWRAEVSMKNTLIRRLMLSEFFCFPSAHSSSSNKQLGCATASQMCFSAFVSNFIEAYEQRLALTSPICQHWAQLLEDGRGQLTSSQAAGKHCSVWFDLSIWQMCYFIPLRWFIFLTRDFLWDSRVDSGLGKSSAPPPAPHRSVTDQALTLRPPSHGSSTHPLTHNQTGYNMRWNAEKLRTMFMISVAQSSHCSSCIPNNSFWQSW